MPHNEIMQQIGQLFILRMNINLVGSVLDSPELFWVSFARPLIGLRVDLNGFLGPFSRAFPISSHYTMQQGVI